MITDSIIIAGLYYYATGVLFRESSKGKPVCRLFLSISYQGVVSSCIILKRNGLRVFLGGVMKKVIRALLSGLIWSFNLAAPPYKVDLTGVSFGTVLQMLLSGELLLDGTRPRTTDSEEEKPVVQSDSDSDSECSIESEEKVQSEIESRLRADCFAGAKGRKHDFVRYIFEAAKRREAELKEAQGRGLPYEFEQRLQAISSVWQKQVLAASLQMHLLGDERGAKALSAAVDAEPDDTAKKRLVDLLDMLNQEQNRHLSFSVYKRLYEGIESNDRFVPGGGNGLRVLLSPDRLLIKRSRMGLSELV